MATFGFLVVVVFPFHTIVLAMVQKIQCITLNVWSLLPTHFCKADNQLHQLHVSSYHPTNVSINVTNLLLGTVHVNMPGMLMEITHMHAIPNQYCKGNWQGLFSNNLARIYMRDGDILQFIPTFKLKLKSKKHIFDIINYACIPGLTAVNYSNI